MLQFITDWFTYSLLRLDPGSRIGQILNFFIYDSVKIILLLFFMIATIAFLRSFLSQRKIKEWIVKMRGLGYFFASLFGAVTPFCSCSSIPIFFGFVKSGIPLGVTFSFLITSPLINEYLFVLMLGFFGWKITLAYCLSGLAIGILAGMILGRMHLEKYLQEDMSVSKEEEAGEFRFEGLRQRIVFGIHEAVSIVKKLWLLILVSVALGAVIHNYVPQEAVQSAMAKTGVFSVPIIFLENSSIISFT